jgi:hypothetical protein
MGYYKQLEISQQADVDRIVQWYKAHRDVLPPYVFEWVHERDERLWGLIQRWENDTPAPKPASQHVALQPETRKQARATDGVVLSKSDYRLLIWAITGFAVLAIGSLVWIARLV